MGRRPNRRRLSWTSQTVSEEWVWMPVSNSSARAAAPPNISAEQYNMCAQCEATTMFSSTSLSPVRTYHSHRAPSGSVTQVSDFSA